MKKLRIKFCDFWSQFDPENNPFIRLLREAYDVELSDNPELLFFSVFGREHWQYRCKKIQFTGENKRLNYFNTDYSIGFDLLDDERHIRWPLYNLYFDPKTTEVFDDDREKFCCVITSNPRGWFRNRFLDELSARRQVDSGGRYKNNVGGRVPDKLAFVRQYRFCFAFENSYYPGYTTEKIIEAKKAGAVPIYWGNPRVAEDFDPHAFINVHDFPSVQACIDHVLALDDDTQAWRAVRDTPLLPGNTYTRYSDPAVLQAWLIQVVERGATRPRGLWTPMQAQLKYQWDRWQTKRLNRRFTMP